MLLALRLMPSFLIRLRRVLGCNLRRRAAPSVPSKGADFCWIEIGAGHGEMTEHLASTGVPVHAVELDPVLGDLPVDHPVDLQTGEADLPVGRWEAPEGAGMRAGEAALEHAAPVVDDRLPIPWRARSQKNPRRNAAASTSR